MGLVEIGILQISQQRQIPWPLPRAGHSIKANDNLSLTSIIYSLDILGNMAFLGEWFSSQHKDRSSRRDELLFGLWKTYGFRLTLPVLSWGASCCHTACSISEWKKRESNM